MASFEEAVALVFKHEGGYVNNPADAGGATNFGITIAVLQAWRNKALAPAQVLVTADAVKALTLAEAKSIYNLNYWKPIGGYEIESQDVANACMDMAVLRGVGAAAKSMQEAVKAKADGVIGPKTIQLINHTPPAVFLNTFRSLCVKRFAALVAAKPSQAEFIVGWVNRAEEIGLRFKA